MVSGADKIDKNCRYKETYLMKWPDGVVCTMQTGKACKLPLLRATLDYISSNAKLKKHTSDIKHALSTLGENVEF